MSKYDKHIGKWVGVLDDNIQIIWLGKILKVVEWESDLGGDSVIHATVEFDEYDYNADIWKKNKDTVDLFLKEIAETKEQAEQLIFESVFIKDLADLI